VNYFTLLICPITHQPLRWILPDETINGKLTEIYLGGLSEPMKKAFTSVAFLTDTTESYAYPVFEGDIFCLLRDNAIPLREEQQEAQNSEGELIRQGNRYFYDQFGWEKEGENFEDARLFEDLRPVSDEYIRACRDRINDWITEPGEYMIDVASGPVQYAEYLRYSEKFARRICVDFSLSALKQAKMKVGDKGIYILGDITNLPFADNVIDFVISLHTIYHVPVEEQPRAFTEIFRVLRPGKKALVVYSWSDRTLMTVISLFPWVVGRKIKRIGKNAVNRIIQLSGKNRQVQDPRISKGLYFTSIPYSKLKSLLSPLEFSVYSWRSVGIQFQKLYIHERLFGKSLLRLLFRLENRYPRLMGRIGMYPVLEFRK
jgi:ubiquinone/menaquinone biosynthesis C-methylase UbiE